MDPNNSMHEDYCEESLHNYSRLLSPSVIAEVSINNNNELEPLKKDGPTWYL